jgi:hypothetical protein
VIIEHYCRPSVLGTPALYCTAVPRGDMRPLGGPIK